MKASGKRKAAPWWATLVALSAASGADPQAPPRATPQSVQTGQPDLPIPRPDLSTMEEAARLKAESMQDTLERLKGEADMGPKELAEGFGYLGQLFHAFKLLDAAEICYENSQRLRPEDYRWSYYLGLVRNGKGDFEAAVRDYRGALALRPGELPVLIRLGNALLELNRHQEAEEQFFDALNIDPQSAVAFYGLGRVASARGDQTQAVESFQKVVTLQPEATVVHYPLGQAYRKLGALEKAKDHLRQRGQETVKFPDPLADQVSRLAKGTAFEVALALAQDTERFSAEEFLGFALSQFGDVRGAIEQLQHGLALQREAGDTVDPESATAPEQARIHYVLGGLLVNDGRDQEAMEQFATAIAMDPNLVDAAVKWGNALARNRRFEEAVEVYGKVLEAEPNHGTVLLKHATALSRLDRNGEARAHLEKLVAQDPRHPEARIRLATVTAELGDLDDAVGHYEAAIELDLAPQERLAAHLQLGQLLRRRGFPAQALEQFRLALETDPQSVSAQSGRAGLLGQMGRYEDAALSYDILVALEPRNPVWRMGEVTALILGGRNRDARDRLEAGLAVLPENLSLKDVLARHLAACPDRIVRDGERATELALELYQEVPTPESMETVAMAYAEAGNFAQAVEWQLKVVGEADERGDSLSLSRLRSNLERYRRGESCCAED